MRRSRKGTHMNDITRKKLENLIEKNVRLFNLQLRKRTEEPFSIKEDYHLSTGIENEIFSWELQQTIAMEENGVIHMMMFVHPIIVNADNRHSLIEFANDMNQWLGLCLGKFWVNCDDDFCYECYLPELLVNHPDELELQLFDRPFSHFKDCLTPLMQLKDGKWSLDTALQFMHELFTEGYVDNSKYGLW